MSVRFRIVASALVAASTLLGPPVGAAIVTIACGGASSCRLDQLLAGGSFVAGSTLFSNWTIVTLPYPSGVMPPALISSSITIAPFDQTSARVGYMGFDLIPGTFDTLCGPFGALQSYAGDCNRGSHSRISFDMTPIDLAVKSALLAVDFGYISDSNTGSTTAFIRQTVADGTGQVLSDVNLACNSVHSGPFSYSYPCSDRSIGSGVVYFPGRSWLHFSLEEEIAVSGGRQTGNTAAIDGVRAYFYQQLPAPPTTTLLISGVVALWATRRRGVRKSAS